jgi:hypothetical protein
MGFSATAFTCGYKLNGITTAAAAATAIVTGTMNYSKN